MIRYDGKGFHPTIRPQFPHRKRERTKLKVFRRILPETWQLSMMKFGIRFVVLVSDRFESVEFGSCESALLEPMCVEIGCNDSGTWYVDTNGCGMLQANQANPPPKKGFARKFLNWVKGFFMNIGKVLSLATLMAIANACTKDPVPNPTPTPTPEPIPTDTVQPIIPTKEIVIDWDWNHVLSLDTVRNYSEQPDVKTVTMHLLDYPSGGFSTQAFHTARDSLQRFFCIGPKIYGSGTVFVNEVNGAQNSVISDEVLGMALEDSIWYTSKGFEVKRKSH